MEKGKENQVKTIKGQNQPIETQGRDWEEEDTDDAVSVMENEQEEVLVLPMQPMALEVAKELMERRDELEREKERIEEEEERGAKQWVNHDETPEDDTLNELYIHDTLTVVTLMLPRLLDYEEMVGINERKRPTRNKRMK